MTKYTRLTISERESIMTGLSQGCTLRCIAAELRRHLSTVSRGVFLNLDDHQAYSAFWAHELALDNRKGRHTGNEIADNVQLFTFIH